MVFYAWYRSEPLASFSKQTAMQLGRDSGVADVLDHADALE